MFNNKKKDLQVTFTNVKGYPLFGEPKPATKCVPDWYKEIANQYPENPKRIIEATSTAKRCMPLFDAMTAGYIMTTPTDVYVGEKDGSLTFDTPLQKIIEFHPNSQTHNHPQSMHERTPKFINGFTIKTPKGYSCLFIPPAHQNNPYFEILPGVVDTDTYTSYINFPFVLKDKKFRGMIPANTPMVQIIPFKRESWTCKNGSEQDSIDAEIMNHTLNSMWFNRYKTLYWIKKKWS